MQPYRVVSVTVGLLAVLAVPAWGGPLREVPVKATRGVDEWTPAATDTYFLWAQNSRSKPGIFTVFAEPLAGGPRLRLSPAGLVGYGGGIDGDQAVFAAGPRDGSQTDIWLYNLVTKARDRIPGLQSRSNEAHPTISGDWVLLERGTRSRATRVLLYNLTTHELRTIASMSRRHRFVYAGQVNGDYAVWGRVTRTTNDVFLYRISTGNSVRIPRPTRVHYQYNPSVLPDGTVYFTRSGADCVHPITIMRLAPGQPAVAILRIRKGWDTGYSFATAHATGGGSMYITRFPCKRGDANLYRLDEPPR